MTACRSLSQTDVRLQQSAKAHINPPNATEITACSILSAVTCMIVNFASHKMVLLLRSIGH